MIRFALIDAPASEPVTLNEAKAHARIRHDRDDAYINTLIAVARRKAEFDTGRALAIQRWTATLDRWPAAESGEAFRRLALFPHNPSAIVSLTVDGVTIAADLAVLRGGEAWIAAGVAESAATMGGGIVLCFDAGALDANDLPSFKLAMAMNVAYWYENREAARTDGAWPAISAFGYDALIQPFKVLAL